MTDTTVKIRAKGCASTGITDDLATKMYAGKGSHHLAIVELRVDETHEKADGDRKVDLIITELEPVIDGKLDGTLVDHVRDIQRALWRNRAQDEGQLPLDGGDGPEPTVEDVLSSGRALVEHDDDGEPVLWDGDTGQDSDGLEDTDQDDELNGRPVTTIPDPFNPADDQDD